MPTIMIYIRLHEIYSWDDINDNHFCSFLFCNFMPSGRHDDTNHVMSKLDKLKNDTHFSLKAVVQARARENVGTVFTTLSLSLLPALASSLKCNQWIGLATGEMYQIYLTDARATTQPNPCVRVS